MTNSLVRSRSSVHLALAALAALALALGLAHTGEGAHPGAEAPRPYIVELEDHVGHPLRVARRHAREHGARIAHVYSSAVKGYAAQMTPAAVTAAAADPAVALVQSDGVAQAMGEYVPGGAQAESGLLRFLERSSPGGISHLGIDEVDGEGERFDVDVAMIDSGIDEHADLDVAMRTDCIHPNHLEQAEYEAPDPQDPDWLPDAFDLNPDPEMPEQGEPPYEYGCLDGTGYDTGPEDGKGHGTALAAVIGELDNSRGGVGFAAGARLWSVAAPSGNLAWSSDPDVNYMRISWVIAALDWVHAHADEIEVVNLSLGCIVPGAPDEYPYNLLSACDGGRIELLDDALSRLAEQGVVLVAAAGNAAGDAGYLTPANHPDVAAASLVVDTDGLPGGEGESEQCGSATGLDDTRAPASAFGATVDFAAPGGCGGGTSAATSRVVGAAAVLASQCDDLIDSRVEARTILNTLAAEGSYEWVDDSGDGDKEPLVDVSDEAVFTPRMQDEVEPTAADCAWLERQAESDVDGDRRSDLVMIDDTGDVQVLRGMMEGSDYAPGGFDPASPSITENLVDPALLDGEGEYVVDVADATGDGRDDLVTIRAEGTVWVHPGRPDRSFGERITSLAWATPVGEGGGLLEPIGVADVTGDGKADLVTHNSGFAEPGLMVLPGLGDGKFSAWTVSLAGKVDSALFDQEGSYFLDLADVNGDGHADVVAVNTDEQIEVFLSDGAGSFGEPVDAGGLIPIFDRPWGGEPVGLGDVNGDGRADLVNRGYGEIQLRLGQQDGTFVTQSPHPYGSAVDSSLQDGTGEELIGLLDYNRDGMADLVTVDDDGDVLTYRAQKDSGGLVTFAAPLTHEGDVDSIRLAADGYEMASEKPFFKRAGCSPSGCEWPHLRGVESDLTRDGRSDLVTVHSDGRANVFVGTDAGIEAGKPTATSGLDPALLDGEGEYVVDVADVTGDGRADLVTVGSDGEGVSVRPGEAGRTFGTAVLSLAGTGVSLNGSGPAQPIGVADVTGDGHADFVSQAYGYAFVAPGNPDGAFSGAGEGQVGSLGGILDSALLDGEGHYFLGLADVDGDGHADLVTANTGGGAYVFAGAEDGKFEAAAEAAAQIDPVMDDGEGVEPLGLGDVTGDERADLLVLDEAGALWLYAGEEGGGLAEPTVAYQGSVDSSLLDAAGEELVGLLDYNRDGLADLVSVAEDGDVLTYEASDTLSNAFFLPPDEHPGEVTSLRLAEDGEEPATEKPFFKRAGCSAGGCAWP